MLKIKQIGTIMKDPHHPDKYTYKCIECGNRFKSKEDLILHSSHFCRVVDSAICGNCKSKLS